VRVCSSNQRRELIPSRAPLSRATVAVVELSAKDRPHINIAAIGIEIVRDDDPAVAEDRAAWSSARRTAQALHLAHELLWGLRHPNWRVRHESVARLVARCRDDGRTLPALLHAAVHDRSWQVPDAVIWGLMEFATGAVLPVLQAAAHDLHEEVRWSAQFALFQKGLGPYPGPFDPREQGSPSCELCDRASNQ
jgi:hypothetical protein